MLPGGREERELGAHVGHCSRCCFRTCEQTLVAGVKHRFARRWFKACKRRSRHERAHLEFESTRIQALALSREGACVEIVQRPSAKNLAAHERKDQSKAKGDRTMDVHPASGSQEGTSSNEDRSDGSRSPRRQHTCANRIKVGGLLAKFEHQHALHTSACSIARRVSMTTLSSYIRRAVAQNVRICTDFATVGARALTAGTFR